MNENWIVAQIDYKVCVGEDSFICHDVSYKIIISFLVNFTLDSHLGF